MCTATGFYCMLAVRSGGIAPDILILLGKPRQALLQQVEKGMRSVIVTAHDYNDLKLVHTVRRLYQYSATSMSTKEKQDLARRWSEAYKVCMCVQSAWWSTDPHFQIVLHY